MTLTSPAPIRPRRRSRSLTDELIATLSAQIRNGDVRPGDKLPTESAIMQAEGVSRTVVREAIAGLQARGLVETRHGIGTFVLAAGEAGILIDTAALTTMLDVMAILELRIGLETEAAGLAANRRNDEQLKAIRDAMALIEQHRERGDGDAAQADIAFHLAVAGATGNAYFHGILKQLGDALIPRTRIDSAALAQNDRASYLERVNREHNDIYDAIARRDPEAARAAMRTHLTNSRERLRRAREQAARTATG